MIFVIHIIFFVVCLLPFYAIGAFPTGLIISRIYKTDITKQGSGSIGATNVARTLGKKAGIITLLVDVCKGLLSMAIAMIIFGYPNTSKDLFIYNRITFLELFKSDMIISLLAFVTVLGHCCSFPSNLFKNLNFKGGKGIATSLGVITLISPLVGLSLILTFGIVFALTQIVSLSSIAAAMILPLSSCIVGLNNINTLSFLMISLLVIYKHKDNILRLLKGEEKPFLFRKKQS